MKLSHKLLLLCSLPLIAFFTLTARAVLKSIDERNAAALAQTRMDSFRFASATIHELQRERGKSSLFLNGGTTIEDLQQQRQLSDQTLAAFVVNAREGVVLWNAVERLAIRHTLDALRGSVRNGAAAHEIVNRYTALISDLLAYQRTLSVAQASGGITQTMLYLVTIELAKENFGQLRAMASGALAANRPLDSARRNTISAVKSIAEVSLRDAVARGRASRKQLKDVLESEEYIVVDKIYWTLMENAAAGGYAVDPKYFFEQISRLIDRLGAIVSAEVDAAATDTRTVEQQASASTAWTIALSVVLAVTVLISSVWISATISNPIKTAMLNLNEASRQLSAAAGQVAASSQNLALGAAQQASALQETTATFSDLSGTTAKNAASSQAVRSISASALKDTDDGRRSMSLLANAVDQIKEASNETAGILKGIEEIAFQTNLLALNAAVEAARAGDAGKGFAVVAEEVRSLAQRASHAAQSTAKIIETSVQKSDTGVEFSRSVAQSLARMQEGTKKVDSLMEEISASSAEQSKSIQDLERSVAEMNSITQQNAAASQESAAASEQLSAQADELTRLVDSLRNIIEGA